MKKDRIKQRRKELKLTQSDVGKAVGVSKATVSQWESGDTSPKGGNLIKLSKSLGVSPSWIETGDSKSGFTSNEAPFNTRPSELLLLDRLHLTKMLNKEDFEPIKNVSSIAVPEKMVTNKVFGMVEDMDGLSPLIMVGDRVFIKPELSIKPGTNSMFWVNGSPIVGMIANTPTGMTLKFLSGSPGWEPVKVSEDDYIGRVIAIDPLWAITQREDQ